MIKDRFFKIAFTLTEVLIALGIVGVIAVLVIPAIVSHFNERSLNFAENRAKTEIQEALKQYLLASGATSIDRTSMYSYDEPEDYSNSSLKFINSYLKVNKTCAGDNLTSCFADKYYNYADGDKKVYNPSFKGSCAILKSGASLCITPKTHEHDIQVIMDSNGKKGPNVFGRDLIEFNISMAGDSSKDKSLADIKSNQVKIDLVDPCENIPDSDPERLKACCNKYSDDGFGALRARCCGLNEFKNGDACTACTDEDAQPGKPYKKSCCLKPGYFSRFPNQCCAAHKNDDGFDTGVCCTLGDYIGKHPKCPAPTPEEPDIKITVTHTMNSTNWTDGGKSRIDKYTVKFTTEPTSAGITGTLAYCPTRYPENPSSSGGFKYDNTCSSSSGKYVTLVKGQSVTFDVKSTGTCKNCRGAGGYTMVLSDGKTEYRSGTGTYSVGQTVTNTIRYNPNTKKFSYW